MIPFTRFSVFFLVFMLLDSFSQVDAQEGFPYCEPLNDGQTPANTVFGGNARLVSDLNGNGVLQLTSNQGQQSGFLYVDIPFPSHYGIKASFEYFSYGGEGNADGLTFFLFDAAVPSFQPGSFGGALGYAFSTNYDSPGLAGAYMGIGLDEYGNFSNSNEGKDGPGFRPDNITVRGPGSGFQGYEYITGIQTDSYQSGLAEEDRFPISSGGINTSRVTDSNEVGYRKVFIDLKPSPDGPGMVLSLDMLVTTVENAPRMVFIFKDLPYRFDAPDHLKVGFAAATGGLTNYHEIRNIVVEVADDDLLLPEVFVKNELICQGETQLFEITGEDVVLPNKNSTISCLQLYKTLEEIVDEEKDPCLNQKCDPARQRVEVEQGLFTVDAQGAGISFAANPDAEGEEGVVYYTLTDNYGQTSGPAPLKVKISGFPEAPVVYDEQTLSQQDPVPAASFLMCEGEGLQLIVGEAAVGPYQWFKDGRELADETGTKLRISSKGVYSVGTVNQAHCMTLSQEVQVSYASIPEVSVGESTVSCGKAPVDLRLHIGEYDENQFDYEVRGPDGGLLTDGELGAVHQAGSYKIRMKRKDLDCWSGFVVTELLIVENPVQADFEYAVLLESGGQEKLDVFVRDPIQFTDLSLSAPVAWEWDFGDGSQSNERNPQHAYSDEGNFKVSLTVYDEEGLCSSVKDKEVDVSSSYRMMYPTAFTPLGSENRVFKPKTKGVKGMTLYVFNSWGDLIYISDGMTDQGWDGTSAGRLQPGGVYVFKVEFTTVLGKKVTDSGKFTLIR